MSALAEKIRKSREVRIEVKDKTFIVQRPTDLDMIELRRQPALRAVIPYVTGWEKVTTLDLYPGGDAGPAPFDAEACAEWLPDRIDLLGPLAQGVFDAYAAHQKHLEAAEKN